MEREKLKKQTILALVLGMLGCILMGGSDWLMIYGDTAYQGNVAWLTEGVAAIPPWRNALALALSFPAVLLYSAALFGIRRFIPPDKQRRTYTGLTAIGMLPWLSLHLFYVMILYLFHWMTQQGETALGLAAGEALVNQFIWIVPVSEVLMLLPFIYIFILTLRHKTIFSKPMAVNNPLLIYVVLKLITMVVPDAPWRLAFTNGLMSESMLIWFLVFLIYTLKKKD